MSHKVIKNSGIIIPKTVGEEEIQHIKDFLTRRVKSYQNSPMIVLKYYLENDAAIKVPRYFPVDKFIDCEIDDVTSDGIDIDISHNITLRDDLQKNTVEYMMTHNNGIIKALPGSGKTVMSVYVVSELKKKTLILVHRDTLVKQWIGPGTKEDPTGFLAFSNIKESEIGRLTSKNVEKCLQKSVIVAMDQAFVSLLKRKREYFLNLLKNSGIGILISDESHTTTGAPSFSECSIHIPAKITFGLSATPNRGDGTTDILEYHLGPIVSPDGKSSVMDGRITVILTDLKVCTAGYKKYIYWGNHFQRSRYLKLLYKSKRLLEISKNLIDKFYKDDRDILYVGERLTLIDEINRLSEYDDKDSFSRQASNDTIQKKLTFATLTKIRDGVDAVKKDCLIISSPVGNIEQLCGRVLRPKKGKKEPIVVDIVDIGCDDIKITLQPRLKFYKSRNWSIKFLLLNDNGIKNISEEEAIEIIKEENL